MRAAPTVTATPSRSTAADAIAAATPPDRDRYVDFLRAASLSVVVLGHWLMAAVAYTPEGGFRGDNVLQLIPATQWLTWIFQVMPVFFLVGGFSNAASWTSTVRKGGGYGEWLQSRVARLVRPAVTFAAIWTAVAAALRLAGTDAETLRFTGRIVALPLWFLAVYLVVVASVPLMLRLHQRFGAGVAVTLAAGALAVDIAHHQLGVPVVGWANFAFVWLFAHQLGFLWRDGRLRSRTHGAALAIGGLALLVGLTSWGGYPLSMVGGPGEGRTNNSPPSFALVALALWQTGAVLVAREVVTRWLQRPKAWAAVVRLNVVAMTLYLWHLTALVAVAVVLLPSGLFPQPAVGSAAWWAFRPVWILVLVAALAPLVRVFAGVEARRARRGSSGRPDDRAGASGGRVVAAAASATVGMSLFALDGFAPTGTPFGLPLAAGTALAVGVRLLRR